jgi:phosphatidylglycerol---prolipoprotein diacylglyceryl transferase
MVNAVVAGLGSIAGAIGGAMGGPIDWGTLAVFTSPGTGFSLGPLHLRWYGLLIASAVLIGITLAQRLAKPRGVDPDLISDIAIWLVIGAIPCARLYYVAFEWPYYREHLDQIPQVWQGGIAIHGAIIGGVTAALIFAKIKRVSFWQLSDIIAPALILGQAIGRWGNFFNSEAFGAPTDLPWKLYIPAQIAIDGQLRNPRPAAFANVDYFHPTFLYESVWNLGVLGLLLWLSGRTVDPKSPLKTGTLTFVYCIGYSLGRVWIEGLRTDSLMLGPIKMAQVISLVGIAIGLVGLIWLYGAKRSLPDVGPEAKPRVQGDGGFDGDQDIQNR